MKPLYSQEEYKKAKNIDKLPCECLYCKKIFYLSKHEILDVLNPNRLTKGNYCSNKCFNLSRRQRTNIKCSTCNKEFSKRKSEIEKSKSGNQFCSKSCAAIYNNTHKTKGYRRSKLEIYIEKELKLLYPELKIDFNQTDTINSELDIYIPSLKIAFELNGIFHYEPIYGQYQLDKIQNNDNRKFQACLEKGIEFCIIDSSSQKYFKESTSIKFLNIITEVINSKRKILDSNQ